MPAFDAFDHGRIEPIRAWPAVALDTARDAADPVELEGLSGTMLWVSGDSTGQAHIRINDKNGARLPLSAHTVLSGVPMRRVFMDWAAQAGKSITLLYGTGVQVAPGNDVANIQRVVEDVGVAPHPLGSGAYWRQSASAALNTIVTPAANVAGVRIDALTLYAGGVYVRLMAKASAPSAWNDGAARTIALASASGSALVTSAHVALPLLVPAGLGVYEQASGGGGTSNTALAYEVL